MGIDEVGVYFFIGSYDCVGVFANIDIAVNVHDNGGARVVVSVVAGCAVDIAENSFCLRIGVEVR